MEIGFSGHFMKTQQQGGKWGSGELLQCQIKGVQDWREKKGSVRTSSLNPTQQREEQISLTGKNTILPPASQVQNLSHKQEMPGPPDGSGWVQEQECERKRWIHQASESTPATTSFIPFPPSIHSKGSWGAGVGLPGSRLGRVQAQAH